MTARVMVECNGPGCKTEPIPEEDATHWMGMIFFADNPKHFCCKECILRFLLLPESPQPLIQHTHTHEGPSSV